MVAIAELGEARALFVGLIGRFQGGVRKSHLSEGNLGPACFFLFVIYTASESVGITKLASSDILLSIFVDCDKRKLCVARISKINAH